ncbi:hypothetical protein EC9_36200 [Rosistilla ulvae]|uniref:Cna protein B-type domain protein n=1 Tax=Rosistilla ulvae TaxID=1930277 RepID=A0A517M3H6_9BACT|nr:carboxypeptidase-like regulatory domain-containing protein [Rosistilla ulvae]QDS89420.1 hypothetical protein EC9_36200 [Rosistilla ulvae]
MTHFRILACSIVVACASIASAQTDPGTTHQALDPLLAQQWVQLDSTGTLHGRVDVPVAGSLRRADLARIALIPLGGGESATTLRGRTTLEGGFAIENVPSGTYALVVHGTNIFATYTLHVLPSSGNGVAADQTSGLQVLAARTNSKFVMQRVRSYIPLQPALPYAIHQFTTDPIRERKPAGEGQVFANAAGTVTGRLALPAGNDGKVHPMRNMNVVVVQGDKSVAMASVGEDGRFSIPQLTPGSYGLIAAGESGFAAVGFEVMMPSNAMQSNATTHLVSFHAAVGETELNTEIVPSFAMEQIESEVKSDENGELEEIGEAVALDEFGWPVDPNAAPTGPNPAGSAQAGSTMTGGGGGGGGGGAGGLEGLGALGIAAAALATQNSNNVASPASP